MSNESTMTHPTPAQQRRAERKRKRDAEAASWARIQAMPCPPPLPAAELRRQQQILDDLAGPNPAWITGIGGCEFTGNPDPLVARPLPQETNERLRAERKRLLGRVAEIDIALERSTGG